MPPTNDILQDQDFLNAPVPDQHAYLSAIDPDFAQARPADQAAYMDYIHKQARGTAEQPNWYTGEGAMGHSQAQAHEKAGAPVRKAVTLKEHQDQGGGVNEVTGLPESSQEAASDVNRTGAGLSLAGGLTSAVTSPKTIPTLISAGAGFYGGGKAGRYAGGRIGKWMGQGDTSGYQDIGETIGNVAGAALGGAAGYKGEGLAEGLMRRGITGPTPSAPAPIPDVTYAPEPRQAFEGENPGYMASTPREELPGLAKTGKLGAGTQLQQIGKRIIYIPKPTIGSK